MPSNDLWERFHGTVMTTHEIAAYGGFQAPREFLERLANDIRRDGLPMSQLHDPSLRVRTRDIVAAVVQREDGEFGLEIEGEIHREDSPLVVQLGSLSMTFTAPLARRDELRSGVSLTVAGNTAWFPDAALAEAETVLASKVADVEAVRLYEFAFDPDPNLVIEMARTAWALLGENALWDAIKLLFRGRRNLAGREDEPTKITLQVKDGSRTAYAQVVTRDEQVAERALDSFDGAVEQMFASASEVPRRMWNEVEQRWDDVL